MNVSSSASGNPIGHVNALLALHGRDFIAAAYRAILAREVDEQGMNHCLARLRHDNDKAAILFDLATSEEGAQAAAHVAGLPELVRSRRPSRNWFVRVLNKFRRVELSGVRLESAATVMSRDIAALDERLRQHLAGLSEREARLYARLDALQAGHVDVDAGAAKPGATGAAVMSIEQWIDKAARERQVSRRS